MKRKHPDHDLRVCLEQMPPDMKQRVIVLVESEIGMTIPEYKERQIKAAEALISDVKLNPDDYSTVLLNDRLSESVGHFEIPSALEQEISCVKMFISYRTTQVVHTDGRVEQRNGISYEEYTKDWKRG